MSNLDMEKLTEKQTLVVNSFLQEVGHERDHLKIALVGAHSHGFASPDSDVDLKGIHINSTETFLGIARGDCGSHSSKIKTIEGVEIDYTSNELRTVAGKLLSGGGNFLEILMSPESMEVPCSININVRRGRIIEELQEFAIKNITKRYYNHYKGFAKGQSKKIAMVVNVPIKCYLYVIRLCLTGAHLLLEKKVETNIHTLGEMFSMSKDIGDFVAEKKQELSCSNNSSLLKQAGIVTEMCYETLDNAMEKSTLPASPPEKSSLNDWLVELRCQLL